MLDNIANLSDVKAIAATLVMVAMFATILAITFVLTRSFKGRKELMAVKLPEINDNKKNFLEEPVFNKDANITVEMVNPEEEEKHIDKSKQNVNNELFVQALSVEARRIIVDEEDKKVSMPEVEEMDYEAESEAIRIQREKEQTEKLKKLAEADSESDHLMKEIEKTIND